MNRTPILPFSLQRLGIIGDVHCQAGRLETVITHFQKAGTDAIVCTGDITDGFGDVERCCELLEEAGVITVLGNHDRWCLQGELRNRAECTLWDSLSQRSQTFLSQLPIQVELETVHGIALLCHGLGANDMGKLLPGDDAPAIARNQDLQLLLQRQRYRYIINGHSHYRMVKSIGEEMPIPEMPIPEKSILAGPMATTVINGGTLRRGHDPGFLLVDFAQGIVQPYDLLPDSPPPPNYDVEALPLPADSDLAREFAREATPAQPVAARPMALARQLNPQIPSPGEEPGSISTMGMIPLGLGQANLQPIEAVRCYSHHSAFQ